VLRPAQRSLTVSPIRPIDRAERIVALDALRGAALGGVLLVNLVQEFRVSLFTSLTQPHSDRASPVNVMVDNLIALLVEQKAMVIFSVLFGVGLGMQRSRLQTCGAAASRVLLRRHCILLVFGLVHLLAIWTGDILTEYALLAFAVIPVLALPARVQAVLGIAVLSWWVSPYPPPSLPLPTYAKLRELALQADQVYGAGSFAQVTAFRFEELRLGILPLLTGVAPRTLGLFLIGAAYSRAQLVRARPAWLPAFALIAFVAGSAFSLLSASFANAGSLLLGLGYAAGFLLACERPVIVSLLVRLAPIGRMALTNYLMQSLLCVALFYGLGLGLMNRVGSALGALIAALLFALQVWTSRRWLARNRFGPIEWLWRRLTYGELGD
jgi:uncharacterized protein